MIDTTYAPTADELAHHGDEDVAPGLCDLAVNVRRAAPPPWLRDRLAGIDLSRYPDTRRGQAAVAARHGRSVDSVLLTAGAAEAFTLIARAVRPRHAVVVHPQFTEPELALRAAGHRVERVVLTPPFVLDPDDVAPGADLVVIGNPTNPTSVLHPAATLAALARPGRTLVVDEAFADAVPGEPQSLAARTDLPGVVVVRSLTKTWGLAGVRAGYLLAEPAFVRTAAAAQPHWSVSSLAAEACVACSGDDAVREAGRWAQQLAAERSWLAARLGAIGGVDVVAGSAGPFLLLRVGVDNAQEMLRERGYAVRSGRGFPGLGPQWLRVAVRDRATSTAIADALEECV